MFTGKVKKIYLKRKRFHADSHGNKKIVKERKKLRIPIERGCREGAILRFAKEGDEKQGYETGDVCVHIHQIPHERFERSGDDLFYDMDISISEVYDLRHVFQTIDNRKFVIMSEPGDILYSNHAIRKIPGLGMPTGIENGFGNLFIRFNVIFQEESLNSNEIKVLKGFFPPVCYNLTENEEISELKLMQATEEEYEMYGSEGYDDDEDYNPEEDVSIPSSEENFDEEGNAESFSEDEKGDDEEKEFEEESQPQLEEIVEE
jgi:DnaJ-class molecular chaperone